MNQHRIDIPDGVFHHRLYRTVGGVRGVKLGFEWHGGAYMQVCRGAAFASPGEVINVWDYNTDGPIIPRTPAAMAAKVDEWIDTYGPENLTHDVQQNWNK